MKFPGFHLGELLRERGLTQKQLAVLVNKKVSEINELIKGKRKITIQRDYVLSQALGTSQKYWINQQIEYDYEQFLKTLDIPVTTELENTQSDIDGQDWKDVQLELETSLKTFWGTDSSAQNEVESEESSEVQEETQQEEVQQEEQRRKHKKQVKRIFRDF